MKRSQTHLDAEPTAAERHDERRAELGITGWMARRLFGEDAEPETDSAHHAPAGQTTPPVTLTAQPTTPSTHQRATEAAESTPGIKALLSAKTGPERQRVAKSYPELGPPPRFFSDLVVEMLTLVYWEGLSFEETASRVGLGALQVQKMAPRQLRHLALFAQRPDFDDAPYTRFTDTRLERFTKAHTGVERRFTAQQYPELGTLLNRLEAHDAQILRGLYGEGKIYREVGAGLGKSVASVWQRADRALAKLDRLATSGLVTAQRVCRRLIPRCPAHRHRPKRDHDTLTKTTWRRCYWPLTPPPRSRRLPRRSVSAPKRFPRVVSETRR